MEASIIGASLTDTRHSLKEFRVEDLPDHSNKKQCFTSNIMFAWESSSDLGSYRGVSLELYKAATKSDICSFGRSDPLSLPSSEVAYEE